MHPLTDHCEQIACLLRPPVDEEPVSWDGQRAQYRCSQCGHYWSTSFELAPSEAPAPFSVLDAEATS